jgi:ComF family protein
MSGNVQPIRGLDVILPIPLHGSRLYERGFNQALLLADRIGDRFSIPVCYDNLVRTRPTRPQVELSGLDRVKNVSGAFSLLAPHAIKNRNVMLVDDVFTTGATMNECSRILKASGASCVAALTLARAV